MKKILITGGAGFIGSNLINQLNNKYHFSIMDNFSNVLCPSDDFKTQNKLFTGDVRNPEHCNQATKNIDCVIHLAAKGNVVDSVTDPVDNFQNNVIGTFNMLRACTLNNVPQFILASTGGALMGNCELPVSEKSLPHPIAPYGASKMAGEAYCHAFANSFNMQITILRFANIYGPNSLHKKGLINAVMNKINDKSPISIYGDGSATRDFLYVEDLCAGIEKVINFEHSGSETFHLSSGVQNSILEVANILIEVSKHHDSSIEFFPERTGEIDHNFATFEKAHNTLDFSPTTQLREGLLKTWLWYSQLNAQKVSGI